MGIIIFGKEISEINRYGKQIIEVHKHIDNEWRAMAKKEAREIFKL